MWSVLEKMPAPATTYERIVYKNPSEHHYMKVCLEFQDHGVGLNVAQFKQLLISALKDLFGEVDAALPLDILTYEEKTLSAILRICSRYNRWWHICGITEQRDEWRNIAKMLSSQYEKSFVIVNPEQLLEVSTGKDMNIHPPSLHYTEENS